MADIRDDVYKTETLKKAAHTVGHAEAMCDRVLKILAERENQIAVVR